MRARSLDDVDRARHARVDATHEAEGAAREEGHLAGVRDLAGGDREERQEGSMVQPLASSTTIGRPHTDLMFIVFSSLVGNAPPRLPPSGRPPRSTASTCSVLPDAVQRLAYHPGMALGEVDVHVVLARQLGIERERCPALGSVLHQAGGVELRERRAGAVEATEERVRRARCAVGQAADAARREVAQLARRVMKLGRGALVAPACDLRSRAPRRAWR